MFIPFPNNVTFMTQFCIKFLPIFYLRGELLGIDHEKVGQHDMEPREYVKGVERWENMVKTRESC